MSKRITDILPKISDFESIPYAIDYTCQHCGLSGTDKEATAFRPDLVGWCDTPSGYMAVFECPRCFEKFRFHPSVERHDFDIFNETLECEYINTDTINNCAELDAELEKANRKPVMIQTSNEHLNLVLSRLNPPQLEAAQTLDGPLLVIAGAGSGKTSVLTTRIALMLERGVPPERILALTFTKKAADEMRSRIVNLAGKNARRLNMGTFHSVFATYLRTYAQCLGLPNNFTILDEDDSTNALKRAIANVLERGRKKEDERTSDDDKHYKTEDNNYKPRGMKSKLSRLKNELITSVAYANDRERLDKDNFNGIPKFKDIYHEYCETNFRCGALDFDDILLYTDILLNNNPQICRSIADRYDYILVDEYQDTNMAQYNILQRLTQRNKNICVVGDDSQSIYAFRGARIENIFNFKDEYQDYGCKIIRLEQNYRSTRTIVDSANRLIAHNEMRIPKTCFSHAEQGDDIEMVELGNARAESDFVAKRIKAIKSKMNLKYDDFAILYRTNSQSRALEDSLVRQRIPYKIFSGTSFFERMEVKDLMAYFKLAVNPKDDESFRRIINKPTRGIGETAQNKFYDFAYQNSLTLWDALNDPRLEFSGFKPKVMAGFDSLRDMLTDAMEYARTRTAYETAVHIMDLTGFYDEYIKDKSEEGRNRADNIRELVDSAKAFEEEVLSMNEDTGKNDGTTLSDYLQNILLLSGADTFGDGTGKVSLMTVHCAKGLEYNTVFVTGMEERLFPLEIEHSESEREEERRLFYVAVTRAKKKLIITKADRRMRFGKWENNRNSMFLPELLGKDYEEEEKDYYDDEEMY